MCPCVRDAQRRGSRSERGVVTSPLHSSLLTTTLYRFQTSKTVLRRSNLFRSLSSVESTRNSNNCHHHHHTISAELLALSSSSAAFAAVVERLPVQALATPISRFMPGKVPRRPCLHTARHKPGIGSKAIRGHAMEQSTEFCTRRQQ